MAAQEQPPRAGCQEYYQVIKSGCKLYIAFAAAGCGYVGLVTGTCLAEIGHEVVCTDNDEGKIRSLRQGGDADLSAIDSTARTIVAGARSSKLVVEKSTVPTQTGQQLKRALAIYARNSGSQYSFAVASNPEFLRDGTAVFDFLHFDRIVIGVEDEATEQQLREIYRPIVERSFVCPVHEGACPDKSHPVLLVTSINSAELIKHACNTFLAVKISYANLIADICEAMGADVEQVVEAMGLDPRIGPSFLRPGLGFGGSECSNFCARLAMRFGC